MKQPEDTATADMLSSAGLQPIADIAAICPVVRGKLLTIGTPEAAMAARRTYNPGAGFRERERLKRKANRWVAKLQKMPATERAFIRAALDTIDEAGEA